MILSISRKKRILILVVIAVVLLYPFESTVVPAQNVVVMTEGRRPVQDATVRQRWQDYSLESRGHEQDLKTDLNGRITFPRRTIRASLLRRALHPIGNFFWQGVHASFGIHTQMFPLGDFTEKPRGDTNIETHPGDIIFRVP
jgi:hypothetical protein